MASKIQSDAAAAAAADARRRAAEEAARKAAAAAAAAAAAKAAADKAAAAAKPTPKKTFGADELSTGQGGALRRAATSQLSATGLPTTVVASTATPTGPTFKVNAFGAKLANTPATITTPPATGSASSDDQIEQIRAQRAQQAALDTATQGLPPDQAQQVQTAAKAVASAQQGITDPGVRAQKTAEAIAAQSAQFKGDPAAAKAFVQAVAPQLQSTGTDLSTAIQPQLHGDDDKYTKPTLTALAQAADNLGPSAGMDLGHIVSDGVPNTTDLNHFDDVLGDLGGKSEGGAALLFGVGHGFQAQGKNDSYNNLTDDMRDATFGLEPGDVLTPVNPNDPDAVGEARLKLEEAKFVPQGIGGSTDPDQFYADALRSQLDAFKDDPAARTALAQTQTQNIEQLAKDNTLNGPSLAVALDAAQAAGGGELDKITAQYAQTLGQTNIDLSEIADTVSPEAAKSLAFAFAKVGNSDMASTFAGRAADQLNSVAGAAKDANDEVASLQDKLDKELANVGPAMTDEQKHDYEQHFWAEHQDSIDKQKSTNDALKSALSGDLDSLKSLAALNPDAAKSVSSCLKELARDGDEAQFVSDTVQGLRGPDGKFPAGFSGAENDLVEADTTASQTLANKALTSGDPEAAAEQLEKLQTFLETTQFVSSDVSEFVNKSLPAMKEFTSVVADAAKTKDFSKITDYLKDPSKAEELNKLGEEGGDVGKLIGNVAKSIGVACYLAGAAGSSDGKQQLLDVLHASQDGSELLADGFKAFSSATKDATNVALRTAGEGTAELADVLDKVNPVLALGVSVVQDAASIGDAINDPSVKTIGAAVGDTLTSVGAAVALFPGGELIGGGIAIAGAAVSLVTGFIQGIIDDDDRKDDEKKLLEQTFADSASDPNSDVYGTTDQQRADISARLANTGANLKDLANDGQLTPAQLVELAKNTPVMGEGYFNAFNDIARLSPLKGQALVDWVGQQKDLDFKLQEWLSDQSLINPQESAGEEANQEAMDQGLTGQAFSDFYQKRYQELYDQELSGLLKGRGLLPS